MKRAARIILIVFAAGAAAAAVTALRPRAHPDRETPWRVMCASHLRQIGTGIALYANDHGGTYPDSFTTVLRSEDLTPDVFVCHTDDAVAARTIEAFKDTQADCSYLYFGDGITGKVPENAIIATDRIDNHDHDGINILLGDGHVEFIAIARRDKPKPEWWVDVEGQVARHARPILMPAAATQPSR